MTRPIDQHKGRRHAGYARDMAAAALVAFLTLSGCGTSKPAQQPNPTTILDNATLADVACNDAGWTELEDYTRTILLQAALYQGHLRQGAPGGPPAGATWLVNGLIDPAKAATSQDFRTWTADATVQAYLKPLEDWQASTRRDYICAHSSTNATPLPAISLYDFVCRAGGSFPLTLGWTAVEHYELALVGQSALFTGWMKPGSAGGPPGDAAWLKAGWLIPESINIDSGYSLWEGSTQHGQAPSAAYFSAAYFSALFGYNQVAGHRLCGATTAEYAKEFAGLPTSIAEETRS